MKYAKQIFIIFFITLIGEMLNMLLPLPIPAGVYGLFLLFFALCAGVLKLPDVEEFSGFLIETMPMMFIPAAVGLLDMYGEIRPLLLQLAVIITLSTVIVMVVTGKSVDFLLSFTQKKDQ